MLAKELISYEIPPLLLSESAGKALGWMDEFKVSHLPVIKGTRFLGVISETDVLDLDSEDMSLEKGNFEMLKVSASESQHIFEVVKLISDYDLSVIPVLGTNQKYIGAITLTHLMKVIAEMSVVSDIGGVIILEMNIHDYSLSQIAQIVESNDAKILGTFITSHPDSTKLQVTIKINRSDIQGILQTFYRYDYVVTASYDQGTGSDDVKERFDSFLNYLNM